MHLKKWEGYYNYHKRTIFDLFRDIGDKGLSQTIKMRSMWARMRMNPRDIADITGATYSYLINGMGPEEGHVLPFRPGERIRLRIINASASTYFDLAIPGLKMTVVQADGQNVSPVSVDELRIAVAETYDVLVEPDGKGAYPVFAAAMDRSGFALASLSSDPALKAKAPALGPVPEREMMGMAMHGNMAERGARHGTKKDMAGSPCGDCTPTMTEDLPFGPDAAMVVKEPRCMIEQPGLGLPSRKGARALCYSDLKALDPLEEKGTDRRIEIHLTGNMERFIWKMFAWDGQTWTSKFHQLLNLPLGRRTEILFVNHTMMDHPIHLHGMWMRLVNGQGRLVPKKHTINIKPAEKLCVQVDADAFGNWAFHCHILYHMHTGMFRVVRSC
jgi:CopA family copper-resistance protein